MDVQQKIPLILIYYSFRGQAQPLRTLFCYLQVDFIQIHIDRFQQQKQNLPKAALERLRRHKIDRSLLPVLIDNDEMVSDIYTIMAYACYKCQRQELLGTTTEDKARLQQILQVYSVQQPHSMTSFFGFAEFVVKHTELQIVKQQRRLYLSLIDQSKYLKQLCDHISSRKPERYILNELSVIDLLFLQSCNYMLGGFDNLDKPRKINGGKQEKSLEVINFEDQRWNCLRTMRGFRERMMNEPFYLKNKQFLESYSILSAFVNEERTKGVKKMWLGDPKFIS